MQIYIAKRNANPNRDYCNIKVNAFSENNNINCAIMSTMQLFAKLSNNYYA